MCSKVGECDVCENTGCVACKMNNQPKFKGKYFIDQDNDCHNYLIPYGKKEDWEEFLQIPDDDERSWEVPDYAYGFDGETIVFENPEIKNKKDDSFRKIKI